VTQVSTEIKRIKDVCSQQIGRDGMSPIVWWAEVSGQSSSQQKQVIILAVNGDLVLQKAKFKKWRASHGFFN